MKLIANEFHERESEEKKSVNLNRGRDFFVFDFGKGDTKSVIIIVAN